MGPEKKELYGQVGDGGGLFYGEISTEGRKGLS